MKYVNFTMQCLFLEIYICTELILIVYFIQLKEFPCIYCSSFWQSANFFLTELLSIYGSTLRYVGEVLNLLYMYVPINKLVRKCVLIEAYAHPFDNATYRTK